jgi:hypothetical protein
MYALKTNQGNDTDIDLVQELMDCVQASYDTEYHERRYFSYFNKIINDTALDADIVSKLSQMNKPAIECNRLGMYINKEMGEFENQQPGFEVNSSDDVTISHLTPNIEETCEVLEGHLRHELATNDPNSTGYKIYKDMISGGYSVTRISTDYKNDRSTQQVLKREKLPYPTMTGFDPTAMQPHKGDGEYAFEYVYYTKKQALEFLTEKELENIPVSSSLNNNFNWCFTDTKFRKIYTFCKFYRKESKKVKILSLSDGREITDKQYKKELSDISLMEELTGEFIIPPTIEDSRDSKECYIVCYLLVKDKILKREETDFTQLPLVKYVGNEFYSEDIDGANKRKMGKSMVHDAEGAQRLLNTAAQQVAYEIETTMAHKIAMDIDSVDLTQTTQLTNLQEQNVLLYRSRREGQSDDPTNPPIFIQRPPIPSIIENTFLQMPMMMDSIMGGLDQMGMQRNNVSGQAMDSGAIQSSMHASPWRMGYIISLNQEAKIYTDMMPKIYKTPRSIPFMGIDGKRSYKVVNDDKNPNGIYMDFNPNDFNISITVGVNAEVSKRISVNQMITMAKMGGWFDEFIVTKCLPEFVSNLDVRHQKAFMKKAEEFMAEKQQEKEAKKQEMMKNPPIDPVRAQISMKQAELNQKHQVDEEKLQQSRLQMQIDTEFKAAEMQQKDGEMQLDAIKALASAKSDQAAAFASIQKADSENLRSNVDLAIQLSKHHEDVKKDKLDRIERVLTHHDKHNHEKKKHEDKMTLEEKTFNATRNREKTNSKE